MKQQIWPVYVRRPPLKFQGRFGNFESVGTVLSVLARRTQSCDKFFCFVHAERFFSNMFLQLWVSLGIWGLFHKVNKVNIKIWIIFQIFTRIGRSEHSQLCKNMYFCHEMLMQVGSSKAHQSFMCNYCAFPQNLLKKT